MDDFDVLDIIFDFVDELQYFRVICKFWREVIDQKLNRRNYVESEWVKTHLRFKKLKHDSRFGKTKPRGSMKAELVDISPGITYQLFSFYDFRERSTVAELLCTDYYGARLKLLFPNFDGHIASDIFYHILKMDDTNDLLISVGEGWSKSLFKFHFESFVLEKLTTSIDIEFVKSFLEQKKWIEFKADKESFTIPFECSLTFSSSLHFQRQFGNYFEIAYIHTRYNNFTLSLFDYKNSPLMIQKMNDDYLILFNDFCLSFNTKRREVKKIDLTQVDEPNCKREFFISACQQREKFVLIFSKKTNKASNVKKLYLALLK